MSSVLVVDIGNTSTAMALFEHGRVGRVHRVDSACRNERKILAVAKGCVGRSKLRGIALASVVPEVSNRWKKIIPFFQSLETFPSRGRRPRLQVVWVSHRSSLGVKISYPQPGKLGADRLANACAGVAKYGAPLIVADFGTAVTFDVITRKDGYVGGIIAPGLSLMFSYLAEKTALLPVLAPHRVAGRVGKNTKQAMLLGAQWGYRGMVKEILAELMRDPALKKAKLVATGGLAGLVVKGMKPELSLDQNLTLEGIGRVFDLNAQP